MTSLCYVLLKILKSMTVGRTEQVSRKEKISARISTNNCSWSTVRVLLTTTSCSP